MTQLTQQEAKQALLDGAKNAGDSQWVTVPREALLVALGETEQPPKSKAKSDDRKD